MSERGHPGPHHLQVERTTEEPFHGTEKGWASLEKEASAGRGEGFSAAW